MASKPHFGGVFQLVHEVVVHEVRALRIEQRGMDIHPHRGIGVAEIVRQFRVGHQVEPHQLHANPPLGVGYWRVLRGTCWHVKLRDNDASGAANRRCNKENVRMNDLAGAPATSQQGDPAAASLASARALIPLLRSAADRIDAARELPPDVLDAMFAAGMFRLLVPRSCGGAELEPATYVQCVEAIADGRRQRRLVHEPGLGQHDVGRLYGPGRRARGVRRRSATCWPGATARTAGRCGSRAAGASPANGRSPAAAGTPPGSARMCPACEADGTPIRGPDGKPWERTALFRREQAKIDDNWLVLGLRGTGSDTYSVTDLFVDDAHVHHPRITRRSGGSRDRCTGSR